METKRQLQVAELIKRNFSIVLQQDGVNIYGAKPMVSVTNVMVSPDLSVAKIYLSVFNTEHKQEPLLLMLEEKARLKSALARRIRSAVRIMPEIDLFLDDTIDEMYRVDNLFRRLTDGEMPEVIQ
jgi:ribosome-binding factor A